MPDTDINKKIEKSLKKLEHINQWISNCDTKSSFLFAFYGVLITILFTSKIIDAVKQNVLNLLNITGAVEWAEVRTIIALLFLLGFIYFVCRCFYFIYNTLRARIDPNVYKEKGLIINSNIFFLTIAGKEYKDFDELSNKETAADYLKDITSQVFINSKIAKLKFENYNKSLWNGYLGGIFFVVYILFA